MKEASHSVEPFHPFRQLIIDGMGLASRKHHIHGLVEVEVTEARERIQKIKEWTSDRYDARYYDSAPYENPQGPATGDERVQHGGAWYDGGQAGWLTCIVRHATKPGNTADDLGLRYAVPVLD